MMSFDVSWFLDNAKITTATTTTAAATTLTTIIIENVAMATHCNLWAARRHPSSSALFLAKFVLRIHGNCYFRAFVQKF